jgi:hypothetical protein
VNLRKGTNVEIDTRTLNGASGEVRWSIVGGEHVITVFDREGTARAELRAADGTAALELFEHTFASADVPNVFEHAPSAS